MPDRILHLQQVIVIRLHFMAVMVVVSHQVGRCRRRRSSPLVFFVVIVHKVNEHVIVRYAFVSRRADAHRVVFRHQGGRRGPLSCGTGAAPNGVTKFGSISVRMVVVIVMVTENPVFDAECLAGCAVVSVKVARMVKGRMMG